MSYNLFQYGGMIGPQNRLRVAAFEKALEAAVNENSIVFDIGTGTGHFAMLAAKLGAAHVYAVEVNPVLELARSLVADNGYSDRITILPGASTEVELPRKADIIVSDLGGALSLANQNIRSLIDARERHLAAGGLMIPEQTNLWAGVASAPDLYSKVVSAWESSCHGFDLSRARTQAVNSPRKCQLHGEQILSDSLCWCELDYPTVDQESAGADLKFSVKRSERGHGIALWTEYRVARGIQISSAPDQPELPIYGQSFLPWTKPFELKKGDTVEVALRALYIEKQYVWSWHTTIRDGAQGAEKASFRQASLPPLPH